VLPKVQFQFENLAFLLLALGFQFLAEGGEVKLGKFVCEEADVFVQLWVLV
jgi:hypothetical protein